MSKQHELLDLAPLTDWARVYAAASETDRRIVDWVRAHPGATRGEIAAGVGLPAKSLDFRVWELAGRSTGGHAGDGLLIGTRSGPAGASYWRYHAREW